MTGQVVQVNIVVVQRSVFGLHCVITFPDESIVCRLHLNDALKRNVFVEKAAVQTVPNMGMVKDLLQVLTDS